MKAIASFLISIMFLAPAMAQDETLEEEPVQKEIRRYTVEVIIFSYAEEVAVGTEQFPADEPVIEDELEDFDELVEAAQETVEEELAAASEEAEEESIELELVLLTEEEFSLDDVSHQFALLDVYETVMHFGWTQATYPEEETLPIELRMFGEPPEGLDGSFTLYLSRYLHLVVDLALEAPDDSVFQYEDDFESGEMPVYYRIQENRIFKNGDIRYFDHPKFGVVAKITRVEEEEDEDEDLSESGVLLSLAR